MVSNFIVFEKSGMGELFFDKEIELFFKRFFFFRLGLWRIFQVTFLVEHTVCGAQNDEFRSTVQLITNLLFFLIKFLDVLFRQHVVAPNLCCKPQNPYSRNVRLTL